ncbi:ParA family protein [Spirillospora sp. NPDC050679]
MENLSLLPSGLDMFTLGRNLYSARAPQEQLGRVLERVEDDYDICFVDCPSRALTSPPTTPCCGPRAW